MIREVADLTVHDRFAGRNIEIFYFDAGGGHRNAMTALSRLIEKVHPEWTVTPVDLQALLEPIDPVHKLTRSLTGSLKKILTPVSPRFDFEPWQTQDIYNNALKRGVTTGMGTILPVLQRFIGRYSMAIETLLAERWKDPATSKPDLVVSVIPNFNWQLFGALKRVHSDVPYVTVVTDLTDYPPHFWMENQKQSLICGTEKAYNQAIASGYYDKSNVFRVSGMILKENFYLPSGGAAPSRKSLGLRDDKPTALIMFGGNGSTRATDAILEQFERSGLDIQSIVMCGNNRKLHDALLEVPHCTPVGFVNNVADYMRLADFFIGKPGPGSISEALHMGLPVIVEKNEKTMPQERANPDWIREHGLGIVVKSFKKDTALATRQMIAGLPRYKQNIRTNIPANRAVYEVLDVLGDLLRQPAEHARPSSRPAA